MTEERVQRALARAGFGSRRGCEELIVEGRVTVNGTVATLGDRLDPEADSIAVDGVTVNLDPNVRYYALHKPPGVVTTMKDPQGRPDIRSFLPKEGPRVFPVGRLDRDSEGLLLLTNDGELGNRLLHPKYAIEKEYLAEVDGVPTDRQIGRIRRGVELDDGLAKPASARLVATTGARGAVRITMTEGRKREVRRLLAEVGLPVTRLVRLRVGPVKLGDLAPGAVRELSPEEIQALARAAGM
ncbi:MAG: pseudouridine synthase [Actinomycetota bacterium]